MRGVIYLAAWLLAFFALFAFASYAPSRYYVLFYPALCGLAGIVMRPRVDRAANNANAPRDRAVNDLSDEPAAKRSATALPIVPVADRLAERPLDGSFTARSLSPVIMAAWAVVNLCWYADWAGHLATTQKDASEMLARTLPPDSVLLGDCAPGLGIYNDFVTVNVMPGLCNDRDPLQRWAGRPRYVVILDGPYKNVNEKWWTIQYPDVMRAQNRIYLFDPLVSHPVGVYKVEAKDVNK